MVRVNQVAAVAAASALVLSVLVGLFAGVRLGTVLVRAGLSALLFGGGSAGLVLLAGRLLPGLLDDEVREPAGTTEDVSEREAPRTVNIVLEDVEDEDRSDEEDSDLDDSRDEELVEEVQEQIVEDEEAAMAATIEEQSGNKDSRVVEESSEEMPDIGAFAGSFVSVGGEGEEEALEYGKSVQEKPGATGKDGRDTAVIARALQTMMKRDGD